MFKELLTEVDTRLKTTKIITISKVNVIEICFISEWLLKEIKVPKISSNEFINLSYQH